MIKPPIPMSAAVWLIFILLRAIFIVRSVQSETWNDATRCTLNCLNGGTCVFTPADEQEYLLAIQSGRMVQQCACPGGYGGTGCDVLVSPKGNDCAEALKISAFAGLMCQSPFTEYCRSSDSSSGTDRSTNNDISSVLYFCTNGGKCKSTILAAEYAPRNTSANAVYANRGCICPSEFFGSHCEFLRYDHGAVELAGTTNGGGIIRTSRPSQEPSQETTHGVATTIVETTSAPTKVIPDGFWSPKTPDPVIGIRAEPPVTAPVSVNRDTGSNSSQKKKRMSIAMAVLGFVACTAGVICYLHFRRAEPINKSVVVASAFPQVEIFSWSNNGIDSEKANRTSRDIFRSNIRRKQTPTSRGLGIPPPPTPYLVGDDSDTLHSSESGEDTLLPTGSYHFTTYRDLGNRSSYSVLQK